MNVQMNDFLRVPGKFVTGVNYLASHAGISMWKDWDEDVIEEDFKVLSQYKIKILRVFPIWVDFQPITMQWGNSTLGGDMLGVNFGKGPLPDTALAKAGISEVMMKRFETLLKLAEKYHFKLIVPLLSGSITYRLIVPPALEGRDNFKDTLSLMWQKRFVSTFVNHFKDYSVIAAWEPGNEPSDLSKADSAATAWTWLSMITDTIRLQDKTRPVLAGFHNCCLHENSEKKWVIEDAAELCDVLTPHCYAIRKSWASCDSFNAIRNVFHTITEKHYYSDIGQRPAFIEETGTWRPVFSNINNLGTAARNILWNNWAHDSRALLWWCAFDQEHLDSSPYSWAWPGLEHGIFSKERKAFPIAKEFAKFTTFLESLPFDQLPPAKVEAVCIIDGDRELLPQPHGYLPVMHGTMLLAQQAGMNIEFQSSRQALRNSQLYLLPAAKDRIGFSKTMWAKLRQKIADGATLYMSFDETYLDSLTEVFSAEVEFRTENDETQNFVLKLSDETLNLEFTPKYNYTMHSSGAEILGNSTSGNPVFFKSKYGKGTVYLLGFPLEKIMAHKPGAFNNRTSCDAWKIYRYIAGKTLSSRIITKNNPMITVTEHCVSKQELIVLAVNNTPDIIEEKLEIKPGWKLNSVLPDSISSTENKQKINLRIPGNNGVVLILEKMLDVQ